MKLYQKIYMEYSCVSYKIQIEDVLGMTYYMRVSGRRRLYEDTWKGRQRINVFGKENIEKFKILQKSFGHKNFYPFKCYNAKCPQAFNDPL